MKVQKIGKAPEPGYPNRRQFAECRTLLGLAAIGLAVAAADGCKPKSATPLGGTRLSGAIRTPDIPAKTSASGNVRIVSGTDKRAAAKPSVLPPLADLAPVTDNQVGLPGLMLCEPTSAMGQDAVPVLDEKLRDLPPLMLAPPKKIVLPLRDHRVEGLMKVVPNDRP